MSCVALDENSSYLRHRALGSSALYKVVSDSEGIVTASVVSAPGLEPGTSIRFLARVAETMERYQGATSRTPVRARSRSFRRLAGSLAPR